MKFPVVEPSVTVVTFGNPELGHMISVTVPHEKT
jgi:hypothetical protein